MKIKITEQQALRLKLVTEQDVNPLVQYEHFSEKMVGTVNKMYQQVSNIVLDDILNSRVNIEEINKALYSIEKAMHDGSQKAYNYINQLPESDLDIRIDNAYSRVMDKVNSLQLVTLDLQTIQETSLKHKIPNAFPEAKPLDITDMQNS